MARKIKQIKKAMTDEFMADQFIREKYGLKASDTFDAAFSAVSFESILFGIVASAVYVLESLFDAFRRDVDNKVATAVLASIPWYHKICMAYQHGDTLVYDEKTMQYGYAALDPSKQLIKYAACRDRMGYVSILVAGADSQGRPQALDSGVLNAFKKYIENVRPAGIPVEIQSTAPDSIRLEMTVQYDRLLMNPDGTLISNTAIRPVEEAVKSYLASIEYGGVFNKTRLIDAVQAAEGVQDVVLHAAAVRPAAQAQYQNVVTNNYASVGGAFLADGLTETISYALQI